MFPFAALVGQERLKAALLLNAVEPRIGGVLIRGEKGTAKSTAARALAALLPAIRRVEGCPFGCDPAEPWRDCPHCDGREEAATTERPAPFVDLPLGATEDRVLGTLDFERALRDGRRAFQPGLLAAAHRGVLYIDEVNLLADHLVNVLLDAAASGINTVEREGIAVAHPARFLLVGTMNPEEGELRPQLLDRFGLMVEVTTPRDPGPRAEIVRRRLAFEADPAAFAAAWSAEQAALRDRIASARERLPRVALEDGLLTLIGRLCGELEVDGLRADLALSKTARAAAALDGRASVTVADIRAAAELVLPHRRRRRPFEQPGLDPRQLDDLLDQATRPEPDPEPESDLDPNPDPDPTSAHGERTFAPAEPPAAVRRIEVAGLGSPPAQMISGRRNPVPEHGRGRYVRAVPDPSATDLALDATIRAAALRGPGPSVENGRALTIEPGDRHRREREGRAGTLVLFVVDASGSMGARRRMEAVKGAVLALLRDAYRQRDEVAVIAFRGVRAELVLPPTRSVERAEQVLRTLPTGGRTPLAHALVLAAEAVAADPQRPALLVLLSDGKANVALPGSMGDPWREATEAAAALAAADVPALVLDTDAGFVRAGRASQLAAALDAACIPLDDLSADTLLMQIGRARKG